MNVVEASRTHLTSVNDLHSLRVDVEIVPFVSDVFSRTPSTKFSKLEVGSKLASKSLLLLLLIVTFVCLQRRRLGLLRALIVRLARLDLFSCSGVTSVR